MRGQAINHYYIVRSKLTRELASGQLNLPDIGIT